MRNNKALRIRLDEALQDALIRAALRQDRSVSSLCRVLLREGLEELAYGTSPASPIMINESAPSDQAYTKGEDRLT